MNHVAIYLYDDGSLEFWQHRNGVGWDVTDSVVARATITHDVTTACTRIFTKDGYRRENDDTVIG